MLALFDWPLWRPLKLWLAPLPRGLGRRLPPVDDLSDHLRRDIGLPPSGSP